VSREKEEAVTAPDDHAPGGFFGLAAPLDDVDTEPTLPAEEPAAILERLGPPPSWTVASQLRRVLEPVYERASEAAVRLAGS